jgi:hypothetical protein
MRFLIIIIIFSALRAEAQLPNFDERDFFKTVRESYYNLSDENINNFTALVTNSEIEQFAQDEWGNAEVFPLQVIWFSPDRLFLSRQGVPSLPKEKYDKCQQKISDLNIQLKRIMPNLQRFIYKGVYNSLRNDYEISMTNKEQTVIIKYIRGSGTLQTVEKFYFTLNGLCRKIDITNSDNMKQITTFPIFRAVKTKWLCTGWKIKIRESNKDSSEYTISLRNKIVNDLWVPADIKINNSTTNNKEELFSSMIKIRNYLFNQSIEYIGKPRKGD